LLNFPVTTQLWNSIGGANTYDSGKLIVTDQTLDAAIISGQMQTLPFSVGDAGTSYPNWVGNQSANGEIVTTTAAAIITGNPGYFLRSINMMLSAGASLAAAGDLTIKLTDSTSGTIQEFAVYVPAAAATPAQPVSIQFVSAPGFIWNNKAANSSLKITLSAALTAGKLYYNIGYGHTAITN
jgi:hypothetical protein